MLATSLKEARAFCYSLSTDKGPVVFAPLAVAGFKSRFLNDPLIIRVPFFLMFSFNKEPYNKKGKRVLLRNLEIWGGTDLRFGP